MTVFAQPLSSPAALETFSSVRRIYTDLDGTLLAPGGRALTDHSGLPSTALAEALVDLAKAGVEVVPVSGRNRIQLTELSRLFGFPAFIAEVGALVVYGQGSGARVHYVINSWPEEALRERTPHETIQKLGVAEALFHTFAGKLEYHTPWTENRDVSHLLRGSIDLQEAREVLSSFPLPLELIDNGIIHPPLHTLKGVPEIHSYHLSPAGVSKKAAIAFDRKESAIEAAEAVVIGDSLADRSLIFGRG